MAKRRKTTKKRTRRRRSVGALALNPSSPLVQAGSVALGFILGNTINEAIDKVTGDKIDSKIVAGGQVGLGALLVLKKGKKNLITTVAGGVMAGAGIKRGLAAFGLGSIGGYQAVPAINGYQAVPAVNGPRKKLAGYIPGHGGMSLQGTPIPMRQSIAGTGTGSGVRDR